jgi:hypothetical protein
MESLKLSAKFKQLREIYNSNSKPGSSNKYASLGGGFQSKNFAEEKRR